MMKLKYLLMHLDKNNCLQKKNRFVLLMRANEYLAYLAVYVDRTVWLELIIWIHQQTVFLQYITGFSN